MNASNWQFPFPLCECYFAGEGSAGGFAGIGIIAILHVPTSDIWLLCPFGPGDRSLCLTRVIDGQKIPAHLELRVKSLFQEATDRCGGVLSPMLPGSEIVASNETEQWAAGNAILLFRIELAFESPIQRTQSPKSRAFSPGQSARICRCSALNSHYLCDPSSHDIPFNFQFPVDAPFRYSLT